MTLRRRLARLLGAHEGRPFRRGLAAFAVVALFGLGTGATYAYWSTAVTATGTATAAQLAITTTNFGSVSYVYGNETLTTTGSVTVTNATSAVSTRVPALTLAFTRASGDAAFAGAVSLVVWPTSAAGNCTAAAAVGSGSSSGTWASFTPVSTTLAKGTAAAAIYCVRSTIADRQSPALASGTTSFVPQIAATLTVGNFTAAASATAAQSTHYIYPLATGVSAANWYQIKSSGQCMDVTGGGASGSGTTVISYPCKAINTADTFNQEWQLEQSGTSGYYEIKPHNAMTLRTDGNLTSSPGGQITVTTDTNATTQLWQPQLVSAGVYQFVNKSTGLCLTSTTVNTGAMTQTVCNGSAAQQHTFTTSSYVQLEALACSPTGATTTRRVAFSWTTAVNGGYVVQGERTTGNWFPIAPTTAITASGAAVDGTLPTTPSAVLNWSTGAHAVRIYDGAGNLVGTSSLTVANSAFGFGYQYLTC
jgi:hypothetical protein